MNTKLVLFSFGLIVFFSIVVFSQDGRLAGRIANDNAISDELREKGVKYETKRAIFWVEKDGLSPKELEDFALLADQGIRDIEKYTRLKFDKKHFKAEKLEFFINSKPGISRGSVDGTPYIYLSIARVKNKKAPYLHEIAHKLAYKSNQALWMAEGFCDYVQTYVARRYGGYDFSSHNPDNADIDRRAADHLRSDVGKNLLPLIGLDGSPLRMNAEQVAIYRPILDDRVVTAPAFYNLSESFVTFLVNKIGLKKLIKLFDSADMEANIFKLTGKKMNDWKADWMKSLAV